jgi:hypothetical protein
MNHGKVHVKNIGADGIGYVFLPNEEVPKVGLCVMHLPGGYPRLAFDFTVGYPRGFSESRRLCVEFVLLEAATLPQDVFVLVSRGFWTDLKRLANPRGSDPWQDFPLIHHTSEIWEDELLFRMPWEIDLKWPIRLEVFPKIMEITYREIALWDSDESLCAINADLLAKRGELVIHEDCCWFVPHVGR